MAWSPKKSRVDELVEAHYRCLFAFAYRLSGSVPEAEDLTQEAFCQAQAKLAQLREWDRAKSWLFTILRNIYLHRVRADKQANLVSMDDVERNARSAARAVAPDRRGKAAGGPERIARRLADSLDLVLF